MMSTQWQHLTLNILRETCKDSLLEIMFQKNIRNSERHKNNERMEPEKWKIPRSINERFPDGRLRSLVSPVHTDHETERRGLLDRRTSTPGTRQDVQKPEEEKSIGGSSVPEIRRLFNISAETPSIHVQTELAVYTDGACYRNGDDREAQASIGVWIAPSHELNVSKVIELEHRQTNNTAEILAAVEAVKQARVIGVQRLRIFSDSKLVVNGWNKSIPIWQRNHWKNSAGKPILNKPEFMTLIEEVAKSPGLIVTMQYVPGHADCVGNIAADALASAAIERYVDRRNHERWQIDPRLPPLEYFRSTFGDNKGPSKISPSQQRMIERSCLLAARAQAKKELEEGPSDPLKRLAWKVTTSFNHANKIVRKLERKQPLPEDLRRQVRKAAFLTERERQEEAEKILEKAEARKILPKFDCKTHNEYIPEKQKKAAKLRWASKEYDPEEAFSKPKRSKNE